jgi:hypothetical protein
MLEGEVEGEKLSDVSQFSVAEGEEWEMARKLMVGLVEARFRRLWNVLSATVYIV